MDIRKTSNIILNERGGFNKNDSNLWGMVRHNCLGIKKKKGGNIKDTPGDK